MLDAAEVLAAWLSHALGETLNSEENAGIAMNLFSLETANLLKCRTCQKHRQQERNAAWLL